MITLRRCIRRAGNLCRSWRGRWLRSRALRQAWWSGGRVVIPASCCLEVPLKCNGAGQVLLGEGVSLGFRMAPRFGDGSILLQARTAEASISIGRQTHTSNNLSIIALSQISIGENCRIGDQVVIYDCDFHEVNPETRNASAGELLPVRIGDHVWLGSRVMILKGVTIGDHSVVAAGSVVTSSIPARSIAAGTPARVLRGI